MRLIRFLTLILLGFAVSLSATENQNGGGGQPVANFVIDQPEASSIAAVSGEHYPYTVTYDPGVWELYDDDSNSSLEYGFTKLDGGKAKMSAEFYHERIHYHELPQYITDELVGWGLTNVEIHEFQMYEVNGKYYIFIHVTADLGNGEKLMGYLFHYLTDDGMLRFAFATTEDEGDVHDDDFMNLLQGIEISD